MRIYPVNTESNQNFDFSNSFYDKVKSIITNAYFNFIQDNEIFKYYSDIKEEQISFEEL